MGLQELVDAYLEAAFRQCRGIKFELGSGEDGGGEDKLRTGEDQLSVAELKNDEERITDE